MSLGSEAQNLVSYLESDGAKGPNARNNSFSYGQASSG